MPKAGMGVQIQICDPSEKIITILKILLYPDLG